MKRIALRVALFIVAFVGLALALDGIVGVFQPALEPGAAEGVLRTFDANGVRYETRMLVIDDGDTLWIQSGHHFRGWYERLLEQPEVELVRNGQILALRAVPVETPEARTHMVRLLKEHTSVVGYYVIRTMLLFAEVKPVRLDPR
jgi:hypothetical protein